MNRVSRAGTAAIRLLGVCFCLAALTGCSTEIVKQQQIQSNLTEAQREAQLGHTQIARQWVDRAITIAPKTLGTYVPVAGNSPLTSLSIAGDEENSVFTSVGDDASVVYYMTKASQPFPDSPEPLRVMADAQGRLGDVTGQRATAAKLAALIESQLSKPGHTISAALINTLAQAYWDAGDPVKGEANYRRVIATYPRDPNVIDADNGLAYAFAVTNDKAHLTEAVGLAQNALRLLNALPVPDEAKDSIAGADEDTLGWVQYRLGDFKNALINLQKGVNANPRSPESRYHLAMAHKASGDLEAARMELSYAVKLSPGYADAKRELESLPAAH